MKRHCLILAVAVLVPAGFALADGDAKLGSGVFKKCAACHTATEAINKVGPSLMGVVGRPVATAPGYSYSTAMTGFGEGGKVWDEATLSEYLLSPKAMVPGTKMSFAGLRKAEDIANLIAYLKNPASGK